MAMIIDYQTRDNGANRHSFSPRRYVAICLCLLLLCSGLVLLLRAGQSAAVTRGLTARDLFGEHISSPSSDDKNSLIASTKNQAEKAGPNGKVLGIQNGENGFLSVNVPTNIKSLLTAASIVVQGQAALNGPTTVAGASSFTAPATFLDQVILQGAVTLRNNITGDNVNIDVGGGTVTASNLVYSVKAGSGISISGDQDLVISSTVNVPDVKTFKKIVVGGNTVEAGSIDDTLTLTAGTNINLSSSGKEITIAAVSASAGWQINAPDITTENNAYNVGIGTQSPAAKLHVIGDTATAVIIDQSGSSNLLDVRSAGVTKFLIQNSGNVVASGDVTVNGVGYMTNGLSVTGPLTLTGFSTANGMLYTNGSGVVAQTGQGASGTVLHGNGAGAPTFSQVDLSTDVTGTLPIVRGGTNSTATPTAGAIAYGTGTAYAFSSQGSPGECLVSGGSGAPSWATCGTGGGGSSNWIVANGTIYPINSTVDLLAGGQSTASAGFAVTNLNGGVPTAFLSDGNGKLYMTADGEVYTTNSQNLTLGNATTGNIILNPTNGSGTVSSTGTLNLSSGKTYQIGGVNVLSSTTLGSGVVSSSLNQVGALTSGSIASGFGSIVTANPITGTMINGTTGINTGAGTGTQRLDASGNLSSIGNINASGTITFSTFSTNKGVLYTDGSGVLGQTGQGATGTVLHGNGTSAPSWSSVDLTADVSGILPIARGGTNSNATPTAGTLAYGTGTGYAFTAQGLNGQCIVSTGTSAPVWADCSAIAGLNWRLQNGTISPINDTLDFLVGGAATSSAKFAVLNVNSGTPTASVSAGAAGGSYLTATGNLSTTNNQTLTLGGSTTGNIVLNPFGGSGTVSSTGTFNLASGKTYQINGTDVLSSTTLGSGVTLSSLTQVGALTSGSIGNGFGTIVTTNTITGTTINGTTGINTGAGAGTIRIDASGNLGNIGSIGASGTIQFTSLNTNKGVLYADGSGFLAQTGQGATGTVLHGNGSSAPSFSAVDLTADVSGVLPIARGGTNGSATPTAGGIAYGTGTAYAFTSAGAGGECLVSAGTGTPTWSSCSASSGLNWTIGSGSIYPINSTLDLLVGGTSTASAKFAVLNVNSGTPTASVSAGAAGATYFTADGRLATTAKQSLTFGGSTTGNIVFSAGNNVGIGTASPVAPLHISTGYSNNAAFIADNTNSGDLIAASASGVTKFRVANGGGVYTVGAFQGYAVFDGTAARFSLSQAEYGGGQAGLRLFNGSGIYNTYPGTSDLRFQTNSTDRLTIAAAGNVGIGTTSPVGFLHLSGGYSNNAALIVNNTNSGDLITASASGTTKFTLANNGNITATGTITGLTGITSSGTVTFSAFTTNGGLIYTNGSGVLAQTAAGNAGECIVSNGGGAPTWTSCSAASGINWRFSAGALSPINDTVDVLIGGAASSSAKFAFLNVNSGTPTASVSAGAAGATYFTADGTFATTAKQTLTIGSSTTGNIVLNGFSVNGGLLYTNGSGTLAQTLAGNNGECLISSGGGAPTWSSCAASSGLNWRIASGAISPINDTLDLLIGSNASTSAKFAVLNVNSGTPTASISGSVAGNALSMTGDGTISTSKNRSLVFNPNGGNVGIGTSSPGFPLDIAGNMRLRGDNTDAYLYGSNYRSASTGPYLKFSDGGAGGFATLSTGTGGNSNGYLQIGGSNALATYGTLTLQAYGTGTDDLILSATRNVGIGTASPVAPLHISKGYSNNASFIVNNPNSGDLITASASGVTKFTISNGGAASASGTLTLGGTSGIIQPADGPLTLNYKSAANTWAAGLTLQQTTGNVGIGTTNPGVKFSANGQALLGILPTGSVSNIAMTLNTYGTNYTHYYTDGVNNRSYLGASAGLTTVPTTPIMTWDLSNKNVGIGLTAPLAVLHVTGGYSNNAAFIVNNTNSGDLITASASGTTKFILANNGNITASGTITGLTGITSSGTIQFSNLNTAGGIVYTDNSGILGTSAQGSSGQCLVSNGASAPSWASCAASSGLNWTIANGAIYPINSTLDMLVGGTSTASAKFAVLNVNTGTPTASISGSAAGYALSLTGDGAISTSLNRTLTINPSGGNVGIGTSTPFTKLDINGTTRITGATTPTSGAGVELAYNGTGYIFAYDRSSPGYKDLNVNSALTITSNQKVGINNAGPTSLLTVGSVGASVPTSLNIAGEGRIGAATSSRTTVLDTSNSAYGGLYAYSYSTSTAMDLVINQFGGSVGIGTTTPLAPLHVSGASGTNAAFIVNNTGSGNLITASASGTTKFTVANNGNITGTGTITGLTGITSSGTITFSGLNTAGGIVYTDGSGVLGTSAQGTSGQCLVSGGSGAPTWTSCASAASAIFAASNGAIYPLNSTQDFLIGGQASSSAKFAVLNVNSGTPTASVSAGAAGATYLTADGSLGTTAQQTLVLGTSTTGNITLAPKSGSGTVTSTGTLTLASGKTYQINGTDVLSSSTLGSGVTTSSLTTVGALTSGSIASGFGTIATGNSITGTTINGTVGINTGAGAGTQRINASGALLNITTINASGAITFSTFTTNKGLLYTDGSGVLAQTAQGAANTVLHGNGTSAPTFSAVDVTADISGVLPIANGGTNTNTTPTAGAIAYGTGTAYAFSAAGSSGQCLTSGGTGAPGWTSCAGAAGATFTSSNGLIYPLNSTMDFAIGGQASTSAKFAFLNVNTGTPTASISASSGNIATYLTGDGTLATTNRQTLTIGNSSTYNTSGNVLINPNGTGNVFIGTSTTSIAKLEVNGAIRVAGGTNYGTSSGYSFNSVTGDADGGLFSPGDGIVTLVTNSNEAMRVTSTGSVGIGDSSPASLFTVGNGDLFQVNSSGNIVNIGGAAHSIINSGGTLAIESSGNGNITIGAAGAQKNIQVGNNTGNTSLNFYSGTGAQTFTSSANTSQAFSFVGNSVTSSTAFGISANAVNTGTAFSLTANALSTGTGLSITSTSTGLTTGTLGSFDWSPSSATNATGDLLSLNVGANGTLTNIFNVKNNGSSVFSVSQSQITAALPTQFTAAGDVGIAYDIAMTNPTASYIRSQAPLYLQAGETFNSSDLTLRTFNSGNLVIDAAGGVTLANGNNWSIPSASTSAWMINNGQLNFDTTNGRIGIANTTPTATLDVTGTASVSGALTLGNGSVLRPAYGPLALQYKSAANTWANGLILQDTTGNIGVGTNNPEGAFTISKGYSNNAALIVNNPNSGNLIAASASGVTKYTLDSGGTSSQSGSIFLGSTAANIFPSSGALILNYKSAPNVWAPAIVIQDVTGNVGINTQAPEGALVISKGYSNNASLIVNNPNSGDLITASASGVTKFTVSNSGAASASGTLTLGGTSGIIQPADGPLTLNYKSSASGWSAGLTLQQTTGNVGIGTINPLNRLDVLGNGTAAAVRIKAASGSESPALELIDNSSNRWWLMSGLASATDGVFSIYDRDASAGRLNIDGSGQVGINDTAPNVQLSVIGNQSSSYVGGFFNAANNDNTNFSVLNLRMGTGAAGTSARFMQFYAGSSTNANGTGVGRIRVNNTAVAYESGGADFAEWFDINGGAQAGDLIAVTDRGNVKASNGASILGVVSDTAAFIGNSKKENPGPNDKTVGLVGQIKTKVTTMNGVIKAGDPIMSSSIPGVGQKTTQAAHIVGKAMEDFDPANGKGEVISCPAGSPAGVTCGKIMVSVQATYYNPNVVNPEQLNFVANQQAAQQATIDDLQASFEIATTGELKIKKPVIFVQAIVANAKATFQNVVEFLGDVNFKGNVTFSNPIVFESKDTAGFAKIKAGDGEVRVEFSKQYISLPITNVTPDNPDVRVGIKDRTTSGFTIYLKQPATQDENFSWSAIIVKDVETKVSTGSASLTPSSSPSSSPQAQPSSSPVSSPSPSASPSPSVLPSPVVTPSPSPAP